MATFNTKKTLYGPTSLIPTIATIIQGEFQSDGYEVTMDTLSDGGYDISITKGGIFKAVLGMKTALKVTLRPQGNDIYFEAGVGIFGQQAIPTIISMFFLWPVLLTQMWGLIQQSKLDDKALEIAQDVIMKNANSSKTTSSSDEKRFCTRCGTANPMNAKFCCGCGREL